MNYRIFGIPVSARLWLIWQVLTRDLDIQHAWNLRNAVIVDIPNGMDVHGNTFTDCRLVIEGEQP